MALRLLHQDPTITISYDYQRDWLYANWTGDQSLESVQAGCLRLLEHLQFERCTKLLNDNTEVTSMWSDASGWVGATWFPMMADAGLEYFAWVYSPNVYSRLSADLSMQQQLGTRPIVLAFDNQELASNWLQLM
ncbi:hypothetical protein HNQ93_001826 [Hymenobacter luteus]|uniref:STAS/SEC14 domain-containing protein n=2 Tax=Hymenobacter TaxID=89966 RepID=A0A7W9T112_9BACT|nr:MULTISPECIES: hypothetical protein [Hymenobacter]MBB4600813.1 hypothetical protein [Hymenobacter latericoloratus]MBB6058980.1 hypothetical protein [Hymenobacter luteus]